MAGTSRKGVLALNFRDVEAPSDEQATARIEMRVKPSDKGRISQAAERSDVTLTTFVRAFAAREAERMLREHQATVLSERARRTLRKVLNHPPPPTAAARESVHNYHARITGAR